MLLRLVFCTLWLLVTAGPLVSAPDRVPLAQDPVYQSGLRALGDELPDLAALRFEEVLAARKDDDPELPALQLRLVESLVRAGQLKKARPLFDLPALAKDETAVFWKARALLAEGHFYDAATTLELLAEAEEPALRRLATLTRARILASLDETREALPLLDALSKDKDPDTATEARLLRTSLHLNAGQFEAAALLLAEIDSESPSLRKQKQYLEARLALGREEWSKAATLFRSLSENPRNLPRQLLLGSVLGHADALAGLGQKDDAVAFLLAFLEEHPDTSLLAPFFARLVPWSTDNEPLQDLLQDRLLTWSKEPSPAGDSLLRSHHDPVATALANNLDSTPSNLNTFSLYHRALQLARENTPESVGRARFLLARLRIENPNHPLAVQSLLETGRLHLAGQQPDTALASIDALAELSDPGPLKIEASDLAARIRFANGDYAGAREAFARAKIQSEGGERILTTINEGLSLLMSGQPSEFTKLLDSLDDQEAVLALQLERALLRAADKNPDAKQLLDTFLREHPGHRRTPEARLAVAELSLEVKPLDLSMALAQLDSVDPARHPPRFALRHLLARLRLGELTGEWDDAIAEAGTYLARPRDVQEETAVLLKLGEAFYLNGNYNQARLQFRQVADPDREEAGPHREVALFYEAKSALRVGLENARADGLELLKKVASADGPLAEEARLQLGRAYIDITELEKALAELAPLLDPKAGSSSRVDALLLAAEAHRALRKDSHLSECLKIYDGLLADPDLPYALNNQVHCLKGETLEQLGKPGAALDAYYRVITGGNLRKGESITEWKWFYKCGFSALRLLEDDQRWRSAFRIAIILKEAKGYEWEKAGLRADKLQLEHQIWDDPKSEPARE